MMRAMAAPPGGGLIPVRMLTRFAYCPRLGYMEWVQGEFESSADVEEGWFQHRVVDEPSGRRKMAEDRKENGGDVIHARSVMLSDERLGLIAKADLLELEGKAATPVEYKRGTVPDIPGNVYDSTLVQVCAQGLLLRANGYECGEGAVYWVRGLAATPEQFIISWLSITDMVKTDTLIERSEHTADLAERVGMDDIAAAFRDDAQLFRELKDDFRRIGEDV